MADQKLLEYTRYFEDKNTNFLMGRNPAGAFI